MQYNTNNFDEIEAYIRGELDEEKTKLFLEKLKIDEELFQDFQLWTKIDTFFEESHLHEIASIIESEIKESPKQSIVGLSKKKYLFRDILKIAASISLLSLFCGLIYRQFYNVEVLTGSFSTVSALYVNSNKNVAKPIFRTKSIDWVLKKSLSTDTTYQFIFENNEPQKIVISVPRIHYGDRQKLLIHYNDSLKMYVLNMGDKKILLKPTKNWEKIQHLPPKLNK